MRDNLPERRRAPPLRARVDPVAVGAKRPVIVQLVDHPRRPARGLDDRSIEHVVHDDRVGAQRLDRAADVVRGGLARRRMLVRPAQLARRRSVAGGHRSCEHLDGVAAGAQRRKDHVKIPFHSTVVTDALGEHQQGR